MRNVNEVTLAYGSIPKDCGTFTFYRNLNPVLKQRGFRMVCVTIGKRENRLWKKHFADENCVRLAREVSDLKHQAQIFADWCLRHEVDLVMPMNSEAMLAALPHLPSRVRIVTRCANAFDYGYRITVSSYERLSAVVATTPKHIDDLVERYGAERSKLTLIPHGIDSETFPPPAPMHNGPLRLAFVGRLEHNQKGVFYLPPILQKLKRRDVPFRLQVAGTGIHERALRREIRVRKLRANVEFLGTVSPEEIPKFLSNHDILLFPSQFEGFGFSLVEGMMAGCVPIASRISGLTDFIIAEGKTGFLCDIGDTAEFADRICDLARDRILLQTMRHGAASEARKRFSRERMADEYAGVLRKALQSDAPIEPYPWSDFAVGNNASPKWYGVGGLLPESLKNYFKSMRAVFQAARYV